MKSFNRRSFVHLCAAAVAVVVLLPRKAVAALSGRAAVADNAAAAALIKKAPGTVSHAPRPRKAYAAPATPCPVCDTPHGRKGSESV